MFKISNTASITSSLLCILSIPKEPLSSSRSTLCNSSKDFSMIFLKFSSKSSGILYFCSVSARFLSYKVKNNEKYNAASLRFISVA